MIAGKLKSLLSQYNSSSLSKNIFTVFSGTAISQAIQVIGTIILALFFSTTLFGIFALYLSFASLISIVATARYEMAVVLPEKENESKVIVIICFVISFIISCFSLIIVYILSGSIGSFFSSPGLEHYLIYVPVSVLCTGIFQALYFYILKQKRFKTLSALRIFQAASSVICPLILWYTGHKIGGLIAGYVLSQLLSAIIIIFSVNIFDILKAQANFSSVKALLVQYKNFPGINSLHAFTDNAQTLAINSLISYCFGNNALGLFTMAYRVLRAPMGVISAAVSQVLFQQMSDNYNKGINNYSLTKKTIKYLSLLSVPLFLIIAAASPFLFKTLFKPEWADAGKYVIYLTPWIAATFVSSPLSHLPNITSKQSNFLIITIALNLISFAVFYLTYLSHYSLYISFLGFSFAWMAGIIFLLIWFLKLSKNVRH